MIRLPKIFFLSILLAGCSCILPANESSPISGQGGAGAGISAADASSESSNSASSSTVTSSTSSSDSSTSSSGTPVYLADGGIPIGEIGPYYYDLGGKRQLLQTTLCCLADLTTYDRQQGSVTGWKGPDLWWIGSGRGQAQRGTSCPPNYLFSHYGGFRGETSDAWTCGTCLCNKDGEPYQNELNVAPWNSKLSGYIKDYFFVCEPLSGTLLQDPGTGFAICINAQDRNDCPSPWDHRLDMVNLDTDPRSCSPCTCQKMQ